MTGDTYIKLVALVKEREAAAEERGAKASSLMWQDAIQAKTTELAELTALYGAADVQVKALTVQVARLRNALAAATDPMDPPVVVDPPKVDPPKGDPDPPVLDPLPGGVDDGSSIINAHNYIGRTAEENLTIPRFDWLRSSRATRTTRVGTKIFKPNEVERIENTEWFATWASCIGFTYDHPQHRQKPLVVSNVGHNMQPGAKQPTKWGERCWSMSDIEWRDCDYTEIPEEHGNYANPSGSTSIARSTARDCGGHFQYLCLRNQYTVKRGRVFVESDRSSWQYPPNNALPTAPQTHIIEDCHTRNMDNGAAKGSNGIECFNLGTRNHQATLHVRNSSFVSAFDYQLHTGTGEKLPVGADAPSRDYVRSYSGLGVKTYADQRPTYTGTPAHRHPIALVHVDNCLFDYTQANKTLMSLNDCKKVVLESSTFIGRDHRQGVIDIDAQLDEGHEPTDEVVIANCAAQGIQLRWNMPDGTSRIHSLETRGRFLRIRAGQLVENIPYDASHRAKQMDSAGA